MNETIVVAIIAAIPTSLTAVALMISSLRTNRKVDTVTAKVDQVAQKVTAVDTKVDTLNESTLGQLGADEETRRIHKKEEMGESITPQERRHVNAAGEELTQDREHERTD